MPTSLREDLARLGARAGPRKRILATLMGTKMRERFPDGTLGRLVAMSETHPEIIVSAVGLEFTSPTDAEKEQMIAWWRRTEWAGTVFDYLEGDPIPQPRRDVYAEAADAEEVNAAAAAKSKPRRKRRATNG